MNATFLITLNVPSNDPVVLQEFADQIKDSLEFDSIPVLSSVPWARHGETDLSATSVLPPSPLEAASRALF